MLKSMSILDRAEQVLWLIIYSFFCYRFLLPLLEQLASADVTLGDLGIIDIAYIIDQTIVIVFMLIRRPAKDLSFRLSDWTAAILGSALPLLLSPDGPPPLVPERFALFLIVFGTAIHVYAKLTLRRSFGAVPANRAIKIEGPYRVVRHPMYLGYMVSQFGMILAIPSAWNITIVILNWGIQIWRIRNEERQLLKDDAYEQVMKRVRYRILPGLY